MALEAYPAHIERFIVVVVMSLGFFISAIFTGFLFQPTALDSITNCGASLVFKRVSSPAGALIFSEFFFPGFRLKSCVLVFLNFLSTSWVVIPGVNVGECTNFALIKMAVLHSGVWIKLTE